MWSLIENVINVVRSPDWRVIQAPALRISAGLAIVVALILAYFSITQYLADRANILERTEEFSGTVTGWLSTYQYAPVSLLSERFLSDDDIISVLIVDPIGFEVVGSRVEFAKAHNDENERRKTIDIWHQLDCVDEGTDCGIHIVAAVRNFWIVMMQVALISALTFAAVFLSVLVIITNYINKFVQRPIAELSNAMRETLTSKSFILSPHSSDTELGALTETFNLMQARLQKSQAELDQARRLETVGTLTSGVAHEFNNLLAVITGSIDLIRSEKRPPSYSFIEERISEIDGATRNATIIVRKLLSFRGTNEASENEPCSSRDLFNDLKFLVRPFQANVDVKFRDQSGGVTFTSRQELEGALVNLVKNGCEALKGKGAISITCTALSRDEVLEFDLTPDLRDTQSYALIEVADSGEGVPEEFRERLFDPFFTTKSAGRGIGLGLWTVYSFVKELGGKITYQFSNSPMGSRFLMILPASAPAASPSLITHDASPEIGLANDIIVLVEDEPALLQTYSVFLRRTAQDVVAFSSKQNALGYLLDLKNPADLLVSDFNLPDGFGTDIIQEAKLLRPELISVLLSGNITASDEDLRNIDLTLTKPIRLEGLKNALVQCITENRPRSQVHRNLQISFGGAQDVAPKHQAN